MPRGRLDLIRTLPTVANWRRVLGECGAGERCLVAGLTPRCQERVAKLIGEGVPEECVNFDELVARSVEASGGTRGHAVATDKEIARAVAKACASIPEDSPFRASSVYSGFRRRMHATLSELREWGLDPSGLRSLAKGARPPLAAKLSSLADVEERARAILHALGKIVFSERVARLSALPKVGLERMPKIVLFCGSEFSPVRLDWVERAVEAGMRVALVVDAHPRSEGLFSGARAIERAMQAEPKGSFGSPSFADHLFTDSRSTGPPLVGAFSAADPLAECEWVLRRALGLLSEGSPPSSLAIYCRALDAYGPLLASAADRMGVPLNLPWREPLSGNGFLRAIAALARALRSPEPTAIAGCLGMSTLAEPVELRRAVERAIREVSLCSGDPFENLASRSRSEAEWAALAAVLEWRKEALASQAPLADWLGRLSSLMDSGWVRASPELADRDEAAKTSLMEALSTHAVVEAAIESPRGWSLSEFADLLDATLREECSTPWEQGVGIPVVTRSESLGQVSHVFVLGMLEGVFPRRRTEDPILHDEDRAEISSLLTDRPPLPNSHLRARAERDEFIAICAAAERSLTFSYPQAEEDRDNVPAFYLVEAKRAAADAWWEESYPRKLLAPTEQSCLSDADRRLARALAGERKRGSPSRLATEAAREAARRPDESPVSPSELREASICPFQYVFRRRLELRPFGTENPWQHLRRIPQEAGLPSLATPDEALARMEEALETVLDSLRGELTRAEEKLMRSGGKRLVREWVAREFKAREIWPKDPGSVRPHAAFGAPGLAGELPLQGRSVRLRGAVTAVSTMGRYAVAHLANARRSLVESAPEAMEDPEKLELGLYLWALSGSTPGTAVEAESLGGKRTLFLLPRFQEQQPEARQSEGLRVVAFDDKRDFFADVKRLLGEALRAMSEGDCAACPGEHCQYCDFGELCRSAQGFAEEEAAASLE